MVNDMNPGRAKAIDIADRLPKPDADGKYEADYVKFLVRTAYLQGRIDMASENFDDLAEKTRRSFERANHAAAQTR